MRYFINNTNLGNLMISWSEDELDPLGIKGILKEVYGSRLIYPLHDYTPPFVPEMYYVIFSIDEVTFSIDVDYGDVWIYAENESGNKYIEEIADLLDKYNPNT